MILRPSLNLSIQAKIRTENCFTTVLLGASEIMMLVQIAAATLFKGDKKWCIVTAKGRCNQIEVQEQVAFLSESSPQTAKDWILLLFPRLKSQFYRTYIRLYPPFPSKRRLKSSYLTASPFSAIISKLKSHSPYLLQP